jgi:hypothetical protein
LNPFQNTFAKFLNHLPILLHPTQQPSTRSPL